MELWIYGGLGYGNVELIGFKRRECVRDWGKNGWRMAAGLAGLSERGYGRDWVGNGWTADTRDLRVGGWLWEYFSVRFFTGFFLSSGLR